jgi:sporulation and spore germination protein
MRRSNALRRKTLLFIAFIVSAAILGALLFRKYEKSRGVPSVPPPAKEAGTIYVTLFFADPSGKGLRREVREIDACDGPAQCGEVVIDELLNGPIGELAPTLPASFSVRTVQVEGATAVIDLEKGSAEGLPEGSSAEMTAVYSIVDSLAFNFPQIRNVKFLVEGAALPTLKGHLDLREPLVPDFGLENRETGTGEQPGQRGEK